MEGFFVDNGQCAMVNGQSEIVNLKSNYIPNTSFNFV